MDIQLQSIHFDADQKLVRFIKERLSKLNLFYDQIIGSEVFLRLDKSDKNLNKIVEIKLNMPGKELFAKKQCKTFEEATDETIDALRRQIKKHKGKLLVK